ncbi:hypothetical protein PM10SUCC1_33130 [Propionigenium maris DSM 9537]|uniref:Uncharacterized protein n=1 Tax=Propionigenium maris DSM 9537 TaxID=1123000 RepID=A0A9W6LPA5_9FUSO|nr:hypothetical protein [Propionigenium maris]GLI57799.1 hypothetical protein PM10SUCC1_33130 [Propionigenium maris DSM 9537]
MERICDKINLFSGKNYEKVKIWATDSRRSSSSYGDTLGYAERRDSGIKVDSDTNRCIPLTVKNVQKKDSCLLTTSYNYNEKYQLKKTKKRFKEYTGNELKEVYTSKEVTYAWEGAPLASEFERNNQLSQRYEEKLEEGISDDGNESPKIVKGNRYQYGDGSKKYYQSTLKSKKTTPENWNDEWENYHGVTERGSRGEILLEYIGGLFKDEIPLKMYQKKIWCKDQRKVLAEFNGLSLNDASYMGFAKYEKSSDINNSREFGWEIEGDVEVVSADLKSKGKNNCLTSRTGEFSLKIDANFLIGDVEYVIFGFIKSNDFIEIKRDGTVLRNIMTDNSWTYFEEAILGGEDLEIKFPRDAKLDLICIAPIHSNYLVKTYTNDLGTQTLELTPQICKSFLENSYKKSIEGFYTEDVYEKELFNEPFKIYQFKRFNGYSYLDVEERLEEDSNNAKRNSVRSISFNDLNFLKVGQLREVTLTDDPSRDVEGIYLNGFIKTDYFDEEKGIKITVNTSNPDTQHELIFSFEQLSFKGEEKVFGRYFLELNGNKVPILDGVYLHKQWEIAVVKNLLLIFLNGKLSYTKNLNYDFNEISKMKISSYNNLNLEDAWCCLNPIISVSYLDSVGRPVQNHNLFLDGDQFTTIVNEAIYDTGGNLSMISKVVKVTPGVGEFEDHFYFEYLDNLKTKKFIDINSNGEVASNCYVREYFEGLGFSEDSKFAYIRSKNDPNNRIKEETVYPGQPYEFPYSSSENSYLKEVERNPNEDSNLSNFIQELELTNYANDYSGVSIKDRFQERREVYSLALTDASGKPIGHKWVSNSDSITSKYGYNYDDQNKRIINEVLPIGTQNIRMEFLDGYGRVCSVVEPDIDGKSWIIKDNHGKVRFSNNCLDTSGERQWKYLKYDEVGRIIEIGILNSGEIGDVETNIDEILVKANNILYPADDEGYYLTKYEYDQCDYILGFDYEKEE